MIFLCEFPLSTIKAQKKYFPRVNFKIEEGGELSGGMRSCPMMEM